MRVVIKIDEVETYGWQAAIRGMRNPKNSWEKSDSYPAVDCGKCGVIDRDGICHPKEHDCTPFACYAVGDNDLKLMETLGAAGTDHGKYLRMITVTADITAPLYWWKEYDTYMVRHTLWQTPPPPCSTLPQNPGLRVTFLMRFSASVPPSPDVYEPLLCSAWSLYADE